MYNVCRNTLSVCFLQEVSLPILHHKEKILDLIAQNQVVFLEGQTGCGKSTQLPQYLLCACPTARILITQPRRVAAIRVAQRVANERGCQLGEQVGYGVGNDTKFSPETQIMFCTTGYTLEVRFGYL